MAESVDLRPHRVCIHSGIDTALPKKLLERPPRAAKIEIPLDEECDATRHKEERNDKDSNGEEQGRSPVRYTPLDVRDTPELGKLPVNTAA